jgi:hemerythrin-like domain-containing protein
MDVLEHLEEEHRKVEKMIAQLEATQSAAEREPILADLGDALTRHMDVEEERVYPIIDERLGSERAQAANDEHNAARDDLARLTDEYDRDGFASALAKFKQDIQHHVQEEEQQIFPELRTKAAEEIADLGDPEQVEREVEEELTDEGITQ